MKTFKMLLAGLFCSVQLFASHSDCFRKYTVTINNQSGGAADFKRTQCIRGASRKTELAHNEAIRVLIQKRGASMTIKAGPENNKTMRIIKFYSKNFKHHNPSVTLQPKGFVTEGFSQKEILFPVTVANESGGIAHIADTCAATGKGTSIPDSKSTKITVKPSGYIVVAYGPEKHKNHTRVVFAEQTGSQPSVALVERGWFSKGIQCKDLEIETRRVPVTRMDKRQEKRIRTRQMIQNDTVEKAPRYTRRRHRNRQ